MAGKLFEGDYNGTFTRMLSGKSMEINYTVMCKPSIYDSSLTYVIEDITFNPGPGKATWSDRMSELLRKALKQTAVPPFPQGTNLQGLGKHQVFYQGRSDVPHGIMADPRCKNVKNVKK
jgi:hypothetical protein